MQEIGLWGIMTVVGPLILLLLFIWVIVRNRSSRASKDRTEQATRANYEAEDRATKSEDL